MTGRKQLSFRTRTALVALMALFILAAVMALPSLAQLRPDATLFGLPLRTTLGLPVALPLLVVTMFWFAARQGREDDRARDDE